MTQAAFEDAARRAMLARLAGDISVLANYPKFEWTCCWQSFDHVNPWGRTEHWAWRFCNGGMPGHLTPPCDHWHHQWEVFLA